MITYADPISFVKARYLGGSQDLHVRSCPTRGCDFTQASYVRPGGDPDFSPASHCCVDGNSVRWDVVTVSKAYLTALDRQLDD